MIRNFQPYARPTFNGERRPITHEGGEVFTVGERRSAPWIGFFLLGAMSFGLIEVLTVIAFCIHRS